MACGSTQHSILQVGVTLSHYHPEQQQMVHTPYNIYLFPQSTNPLEALAGNNNVPNPTGALPITLSVGAMEFLRNNHMDFQKWITTGIPFVKVDDWKILEKSYQNTLQHDTSFLIHQQH
eukprot:UN08169